MLIHVDCLDLKELEVYHTLNEKQLYHYYEPEVGVFIAESYNVIARAIKGGYQPISFLVTTTQYEREDVKALVEQFDVPCYLIEEKLLSTITGFPMTRGMLACFRRQEKKNLFKLLENAKRIVVLEDVMNPTNVGAIFRNAAALDMDSLLVTKACADPLQRRSSRVAMGTVFQMPWETIDDIEQLKKMGFKLVAMALKKDSVTLDEPALRQEKKLAIIMGTESTGIKETTLSLCDYTVMIPMANEVDSLNVAAASAIAFYALKKGAVTK